VKTIAVINQKGGVGKTTTVANLGAAVADRGREICLIDMDPQSHLSLYFGLEVPDSQPTMYDVLLNEAGISAAAEMLSGNLCLLPASTDLAAAETELAAHDDRALRLRAQLQTAQSLPHEFVLIDCPPSLGLLTLNALAAADEVMIPLQPHFLAMQGLAKLLETIALVRENLNPQLTVGAVVFCMYESVMKLTRDVVAEVREFFQQARGTECPWSNTRVYRTVVRRNVRLAECPSYGKTIFEYDGRCNGACDYTALATEFLSHHKAPRPPAGITPPPPYAARTDPQPAGQDSPCS
jgi:chromosome partitioning protein